MASSTTEDLIIELLNSKRTPYQYNYLGLIGAYDSVDILNIIIAQTMQVSGVPKSGSLFVKSSTAGLISIRYYLMDSVNDDVYAFIGQKDITTVNDPNQSANLGYDEINVPSGIYSVNVENNTGDDCIIEIIIRS